MQLDIVTVHLSDFDGLKRTFASLESMLARRQFRWIVIDGGSVAATTEQAALMRTVSQRAACFLSEDDNGIYDAMNKGTSLADADYVLYLNAGDELHKGFSLSELEAELGSDKPEMIWGTCYERFPAGALVRTKTRSPQLAWYGIPVNHQNVLFRRDVLGEKPYSENYKYCADYDLICRLLKRGHVYRTAMPFVTYERGGVSARNFADTMAEEELLRSEHFGLSPRVSMAITCLKKINAKIGSLPAIRRLMRRWI